MATADEPVALKRRRATILGSCTRVRTFVDAVTSLTPSMAAQLEERRSKLDRYWSDYDTVQTKLELLDESEADHRVTFEEAFYSLSAKLRELLEPTIPMRVSNASPTSSTNVPEYFNHVRLPKLNLPTFSGKYDEWLPFFDTFNAAIHSNISLSNVQRLQYLRASLIGDASKVIDALEISDANYEVAWNLLRERYDNRRVIVQSHIKAIMDLPQATRENTIELRQIADGATRHIHALQALKRPTSQWDDLLVYILSRKLDAVTLREWQLSLTGSELPTLKQFINFVAHRCQTLEATGRINIPLSKSAITRPQSNAKRQSSCVATVAVKCIFCNKEHLIYQCQNFLALSVPQRISEIKERKLCTNCLRSADHSASKCPSSNCKICKQRHNTLLHRATTVTEQGNQSASNREGSSPVSSPTALVAHDNSSFNRGYVMLSTAVIYAYDSAGARKSCRVLLDSGSQANFISKRFLGVLGLETNTSDISISGISETSVKSSQSVNVRLQSRISSFSLSLDCIVMDHVTINLPVFTLKRTLFDIPSNLVLADPQFHVSSEIDILIGAEYFWQLLCVVQVRASQAHPTMQKTRFGWVLAGKLASARGTERSVQALHAVITNDQLHDQLSRFWRMEEVAENLSPPTREEVLCEQHYLQNMSRTSEGRFIVKLPFKTVHGELGSSRDIALRRFRSLERRFERDPALKAKYSQFMSEYLALGHMKLIDVQANSNLECVYLPHHGVFKKGSDSNKIRVVFDASCKTSTGVSLNDVLATGSVIQQDLFNILVRFRTFLFVLAADIIKMYRQVLLHPSETRYQRILWRNDSNAEIETYELVTVTYGTAPASFLTTRCLKHLAENHGSEFPSGSISVGRDFYVDDMLTGADTVAEAKTIRDETIDLLRLGAFELSKWSSNCPELLAHLDDRSTEVVTFNESLESSILGIHWNQFSDSFHFSYNPNDSHNIVSKRTILADISRLFDPLGLLGPIVVLAKLILQELWQLDVHWDESVPQDLYLRWSKLKSSLTDINQLFIPRCVKLKSDRSSLQIHGFCDASQRAYGACVYVRTDLGDNKYRVELWCSKSRVALLKAVSLPRLELSAALVLARLVKRVATSVDLVNVKTFLWSDSTIVLNWISSQSRRWSVFVANRVGEIQTITSLHSWHHVKSVDNPADVLSRGLEPGELANSPNWWHGPAFLRLSEDSWSNNAFSRSLDELPEQRAVAATVANVDYSIVNDLLGKHSRLSTTCRVMSYCLRLLRSRRHMLLTIFISPTELWSTLRVLCKVVQGQAFPEECKALQSSRGISASSSILALSPFVDKDGLIRVGGRLINSELEHDACHPILLPGSHILTRRIIEQEHMRNAHAGTQATMAAVRQRFWPTALRSNTRKVLRNCVTCFKVNPRHSEAIMGSLPAGRVTVSRPFSHCGVDYAGPFLLRESKRRNAHNHKAYLAIFVCFATKAAHLELVSDLTSDSFIAALKRFVSRRGKPICIHSDNGTTFVGAQRQLKEFFELLSTNHVQDSVRQFLREQGTSWRFIPPNAPHMGGLWEAAVKSAKHHLYRITGKAHLTFEELQTIFCEIEAILNSRPITPLSADPNDLTCLTPGHFLIGTALNSLPYIDLSDVNENRLVRWQRVQQVRQHFWQRWSREYLHTLQERSKWRSNKGEQLKPGQMVTIQQQGLVPFQWLLGRVEEVHPGADNIVRTVTVRTARGSLTRPLTKIAILPVD